MSCAAAFAEMPHPSHGRKVFLSTDYAVALRGHFAGLTEGGADAVAFAVDEASHLRQVTVPPGDVIDRGGLRNEGVVGLHHPLNPVLDRLHQRCAGLAAHESPHLLKSRHLGFLKGAKRASLKEEGEKKS